MLGYIVSYIAGLMCGVFIIALFSANSKNTYFKGDTV